MERKFDTILMTLKILLQINS
uniref:Uncharacterized protein n=1 Tax=Rhizophora mucronata TaxID=61149 RepID=A0A2P2Q6Z6_RHIMU